jgi:peptidoglycan glycosyltransferase
LVIGAGCTPGEVLDERVSAAEAADAFASAWTNADFSAMTAFFDEESADRWDEDDLARAFDRIYTSGEIDSATVSVDDGPDDEGTEDVAELALTIVYTSDVLDEPVVLEGPFEMTYSDEDDAWQTAWDQELLWPGMQGARRFRLVTRFGTRAALLDRSRHKIAAGAAAERRYPFRSVAGTTVGHIEPVKKKDIPEGSPLQPGDLVGGSGLEEAFDTSLSGTPDVKLQVLGRKGKVLATVGRQEGDAPRAVRTTLDIGIQRAAEEGFGATIGGAIVLDPNTGSILAAVASSPFDPSNYVGVPGIEPFNRALSGLYPPGSSMKVMTAATALDLGEVKPSTPVTGPAEYKGVRNFESGAFGTIPFSTALQKSVNTAFAQVAEKIGPKRLKRYADMFGFNRSPTMPLQAAKPSFPFPEDEGDLMWGAIGQAQTLATPLQMATIAATIANDGKRMEPRIEMAESPSGERVVSRKTARTMTALMESVVQGGTGVAAQISGVRVAGKTGTAEVDVGGIRKNHAWFICFAPADDPEVVVAVVAEYGGVGGQVAAPLARSILTRVLPLI